MTEGIELLTFGCRLNLAESDRMRELAEAAGLADTIIVNTCAVTAEAERQARQAIRRARRQRPGATIVVTGCGAQIDAARYGGMSEADHCIGNAEKLRAETWIGLKRATRLNPAARVQVGDIMRAPPAPSAVVGDQRTRAFVEVQQGCDHRCTFCVIPYGRGPSRSLPIDQAVAALRPLVAGGVREIVLTGVDLMSWGGDLPDRPTFATLVRALLEQVPDLPRLRLSSLDPAEIDEGLIALYATQERLMPHLHLSLQAGDDLILKRMKRRHDRAQALAVIGRLRAARPDCAIGADLIAGFPTEDAAMFARSLALIDEARLDVVHVFPYSPRPGTPAARMKQLAPQVVQARAAGLRTAGAAAHRRFLARQVGRLASVLVERSGRRGHTENFAAVRLDRPAVPGTLVATRITGVDGDTALGSVIATEQAA